MVLGGLPEPFKPLAVHVTQNEDNVTFADLKRRLRVYEESEKMKMTEQSADNVMKTFARQNKGQSRTENRKYDDADMTCYKCGTKGHRARKCNRRVWCGHCKNATHAESICKKKHEQDGARKFAEEQDGWSRRLLLQGQIRPARETTGQREEEGDHGGCGSDFPHRQRHQQVPELRPLVPAKHPTPWSWRMEASATVWRNAEEPR